MADYVDQNVLTAQRWVNSQYSSKPGYQRCPEDGRTGWSTMYSLIMGLQVELGITALSANFGPGTLSRLEARGALRDGESNGNIVRIVQGAFYCKGYNPYAQDGDWGPNTTVALNKMKSDQGLSPDGILQPKVFKSLLTMDAYVKLGGGNDQVRAIQQWLNRSYWTRPWFFIIPCDGIYSRDVQKALLMVIQSTIGVADSGVNGVFGPATRAGLQAHEISQGASGIWVQLLSAACVFNGTIPAEEEQTATSAFKTVFDDRLAQYLDLFQKFTLLPRSGRATYATWAELLVSTGDPTRHTTGCDTSKTITPAIAAELVRQGYKVVGRYLQNGTTPSTNLDKEIKPGELDTIFNAGLRVFPIWQFNARLLSDFTYEKGRTEGRMAHERMKYYKFRPGVTIYFAVDYDATDANIDSNILPYFRGVQLALSSLGKQYRAGVYGSRNVCTRISDGALTGSSFVSGMSTGFSGNLGYPLPRNWAYSQIREFKFSGGAETIDLDNTVNRWGDGAGIGADGREGGAAGTLAATLARVDAVYAKAKAYNASKANELTMMYLRHPNYSTQYPGWLNLLPFDQRWIDEAVREFGDVTDVVSYADPKLGVQVKIDHLIATAACVQKYGSGNGSQVTLGDFGGWGGDIITFYCDWRSNLGDYKDPYAFCQARLAKQGQTSSFGFSDLIEDVDGFLIGEQLRSTGLPFNQILRTHLETKASAQRFQSFWNKRFNSNVQTASDAAIAMLTNKDVGGVFNALRTGLFLQMIGPLSMQPEQIPSDQLNRFVQGFADTLRSRAQIG